MMPRGRRFDRRRVCRLIGRTASGQAAVEFALVVPIFLLVVFSVFDIGRVVFVNAQLENAVREGVRAGIGMAAQGKSETQIKTAAENTVKAQPMVGAATVAASCDPAGCAYNARITVSATLATRFVAAGMLPGIPSPTLSAAASGKIE